MFNLKITEKDKIKDCQVCKKPSNDIKVLQVFFSLAKSQSYKYKWVKVCSFECFNKQYKNWQGGVKLVNIFFYQSLTSLENEWNNMLTLEQFLTTTDKNQQNNQ